MQTQTVGSKLLKVVGILLIVFGSIGLVGAIVTIGGIALLISLGYNGTLLYVAAAISIISAIVNFVAGIIGVTSWNKPEKSKTCMILGILMIVCQVAALISNIVSKQSAGTVIFSTIVGLVLPVLYIMGAKQLEKMK